MIVTFKHKGLKEFFDRGITSKISTNHLNKIRLIIANLNAATEIKNMNLPGLNLHKLQGDKKDFWSLKIDGNWRLIFRFEKGNAYDVDYVDYH